MARIADDPDDSPDEPPSDDTLKRFADNVLKSVQKIRDELDVDLNKPFDAGSQTPPQGAPNYSRPGVDDLKPQESADKPDPTEND